MLIRFGFENHRSFLEPAEVSFVASSLKDSGVDLIRPAEFGSGLLPTILIYGANASGKTNIVSALRFMRAAVIDSHTIGSPTGGVPRYPFLLRPDPRTIPSQFSIDFLIEGLRYHYGFTCDDSMFISEWLYSFPNNRRQILFERNNLENLFSYGRELRGQNKIVESLTRPNSLFVSAAAQNNHEILTKIFQIL